jgi:DNA repair exonuclease SbcCD ATPase subunit
MSARRRTLVLPAQTGDQAAASELARQDSELDRAQREARDLGQALEDAKIELADAQERAAAAVLARNHAKAAELERAAAAAAAKVDNALAAIKEATGRVAELMAEAAQLSRKRFLGPAPGHLTQSAAWKGALAYHRLAAANSVNIGFLRSFCDGVCGAPAGDDQDDRAA